MPRRQNDYKKGKFYSSDAKRWPPVTPQTEVTHIYLDGKHPRHYHRADLRYTCLRLVFLLYYFYFQKVQT